METVHELESVFVDGYQQQTVRNHEQIVEIAGKLKPYQFLILCTGAKAVPAGGWGKKTSACALTVIVPITEAN